jgi:hypothetical protein
MDAQKRRKSDEYNRVSARVAQHLNDLVGKWDNDTVNSIISYEVTAAIGEDSKLVHEIIHRIDGGSNGVTIFKGDYERAVARRR